MTKPIGKGVMGEGCQCDYLIKKGNKFEIVHSVHCQHGAYSKYKLREGFASVSLPDIEVQMQELCRCVDESNSTIQSLQSKLEKVTKIAKELFLVSIHSKHCASKQYLECICHVARAEKEIKEIL